MDPLYRIKKTEKTKQGKHNIGIKINAINYML
jgi:translation elongation factor P/translation initiation factor 5A